MARSVKEHHVTGPKRRNDRYREAFRQKRYAAKAKHGGTPQWTRVARPDDAIPSPRRPYWSSLDHGADSGDLESTRFPSRAIAGIMRRPGYPVGGRSTRAIVPSAGGSSVAADVMWRPRPVATGPYPSLKGDPIDSNPSPDRTPRHLRHRRCVPDPRRGSGHTNAGRSASRFLTIQ